MYSHSTLREEEKSIILKDQKKNGKEQSWKEKKVASLDYAELLHILEFNKASRVQQCGTVLDFNVDHEGYLTLAHAWFCKSRLCQICNWRRAMKHSGQTKKIVAEVVRRKPKARWLFLTFTVKNVYDGEELSESLSKMARGFRKMVQYKKIDKNLIGFMRASEVTVNSKDNSYNQHLHVLLCLKSTFFSNQGNYITHKQWTEFWQKAMKLDYRPVVHVQAIKPKNNKKSDVASAVDETAKYPVKSADYMTDDQEQNLQVVKDLEEGLRQKRLISYGGLLKEVHKELHMDEVDDEETDLVHTTEDDEAEEIAYRITAIWNWEKKNYMLK